MPGCYTYVISRFSRLAISAAHKQNEIAPPVVKWIQMIAASRPRVRRPFACLCFAVSAFLAVSATPAFAQSQESPARAQIEQLIRQSHADVAVAFRSLDGSQELFIRAGDRFAAAAAEIQVPVMMELYAEVQAGTLRLSETLVVHNSFRSYVGGTYQLDPKADPDQDLYKLMGKPVSLQDLCEHMVARNSSLAADLLIEKIGIDRINTRARELHAGGVELIHAIEPRKPDDPTPENATSARGVLELLWSLAKGQDNGDDASKQMVGMMARAALQQPPTSGLPSDPRARETASLAATNDQAMIVLGPRPFVVVILVRGLTNPEAVTELEALIEHDLAAGLSVTAASPSP